MTNETPAPACTPFELALRSWPGGDLIGDRWKTQPRRFCFTREFKGQWMLDAIVDTFATHTIGGDADDIAIVGPKMPLELLGWYVDECGPYAAGDWTSALGAKADSLDDTALAAVLGRASERHAYLEDDELVEFLCLVGAAADDADVEFSAAVELAPDGASEFDHDTFVDVLRTATT